MGVVHLDNFYPPVPGDMDSPESFGYPVYYRVVPGLTYEMCKSGTLSPQVAASFAEAIRWLDEEKDVQGISGDCGFMIWFQEFARNIAKKPVFMSPLSQLPTITRAYAEHEDILILTSSEESLKPMNALIKHECGIDLQADRYKYVGLSDIPGFDAQGYQVDFELLQVGIVKRAREALRDYPRARAILLE